MVAGAKETSRYSGHENSGTLPEHYYRGAPGVTMLNCTSATRNRFQTGRFFVCMKGYNGFIHRGIDI